MSGGRTYAQPIRRPLTPLERRFVSIAIYRARARLRHQSRRTFVGVAGVALALWLATIASVRAVDIGLSLAWAGASIAFAFFVRRDFVKEADACISRLQSILRHNTVDEYSIKASAYADFEEVEDEGACYAFELDGDRLLFVLGQDYYRQRGFPSLTFTMAHLLTETGVIGVAFLKGGSHTRPSRTILAEDKQRLPDVDHLEIVSGRVDSIEALFARG